MNKKLDDKTNSEDILSRLDFSIPELEELNFSRDTNHPILKAAWFKMTGRDFAITTKQSRKIYVKEINRLNDFFCNKGYTSIDNTPVTIFNEYGVYISVEGSSYRITRPHVIAVEKYIENSSRLMSHEEFDFLVKVTEEFDLQRRPSQKRPPLSILFDECPYTDAELLVSLRVVCAHIICMEQEVKENILDQQCCSFLKSIETEPCNMPIYKAINSTRRKFKELIAPVMKAISLLDSKWAKECILTTFLNNAKSEFIINSDNINELYKEFTSGRNLLITSPLPESKKNELKIKLQESRPSMRYLAEKYGYKENQVHAVIRYPGVRGSMIPIDIQEFIRADYNKSTYTRSDARKEYNLSNHFYQKIIMRDCPEFLIVKSTSQPRSKYYTVHGRIPSLSIFRNNFTVEHYAPKNLISASSIQEFLFYCLLSSEGPQSSGIERLTFSDIKQVSHVGQKETIQFNYKKGRANAVFSTALYSNKDKADVFLKHIAIWRIK